MILQHRFSSMMFSSRVIKRVWGDKRHVKLVRNIGCVVHTFTWLFGAYHLFLFTRIASIDCRLSRRKMRENNLKKWERLLEFIQADFKIFPFSIFFEVIGRRVHTRASTIYLLCLLIWIYAIAAAWQIFFLFSAGGGKRWRGWNYTRLRRVLGKLNEFLWCLSQC